MDCIFCRIISGQIPAKIAYEDEKFIAIHDVAPKAPLHILIIPKQHHASILDLSDDQDLLGKMMALAARLAVQEGVDEKGFRLVINTGPAGGQSVDHLHLHLLGGRSMGWPPG
jgi:histidine triad (HIT) family protein